MDIDEFHSATSKVVDFIVNYRKTLSERRVTANVQPGYLKELIPLEAPKKGVKWDDIMEDLEKVIMPGMTHWQHPHFHGFFSNANTYVAALADLFDSSFGNQQFSWVANPVSTELEMITLDWIAKALGLPEQFHHYSEKSKGGGVIQGSASICVLTAILAARHKKIAELRKQHPFTEEGVMVTRLIAYCSKESHCCAEKAAMLALVKLRTLETDDRQRVRGDTVREAIEKDRAAGLIPFFVSTTLGTTSVVSFDKLDEIGPICEENGLWLHVDGAYGGPAFLCPEFRYLMKGVEYADTFNVNGYKFMLINFDCSFLWVKNKADLTKALIVDPLYLHDEHTGATDFRHWSIPLSRGFRSLKIWFVMRSYGIEGMQKYIRNHCRLAKVMEKHIKSDQRFEICNDVILGLVCFRLRGESNEVNAQLVKNLNSSGKILLTPASVDGKVIIRFAICFEKSNEEVLLTSWKIIQDAATSLLEEDEAVAPLKPIPRRTSKQYDPVTRQVSEVAIAKRKTFKRSASRSAMDLVDFANLSLEEMGLDATSSGMPQG